MNNRTSSDIIYILYRNSIFFFKCFEFACDLHAKLGLRLFHFLNCVCHSYSIFICSSALISPRLLDILPRLKRVGFLCASAGRRIRYGLTPAPQFGDAPPKYILSRIEVAVVYLTAFGTYPAALCAFDLCFHFLLIFVVLILGSCHPLPLATSILNFAQTSSSRNSKCIVPFLYPRMRKKPSINTFWSSRVS